MKQLRKIFSITLLILVASCGKDDDIEKVIPCIPNGLANYVIAFYPFSNGSLNDISGNSQNLTNSTTANSTSDRNGNIDCAYEFDNSATSSEFLTTTNTTFLNSLNEFSISLWYQPKDTSRAGGDFESLINRDLGGSCPDRNGQWSVGLYDCRKAVFGRTNSVWDNNITNFDCQQEIIVRTDNWNHLVATFNQNGIEMKIYRNGTLQESSIGNANCGSGTPSYQDIGDLFLGKDYTGKIDDVIIFNKTLSQQEVNSLFNMETCCN
jgi:hypothetical protein